jgi:hypothetical protein
LLTGLAILCIKNLSWRVPLYFAFVVYRFVKGGVWGGVGAAVLLALYATSLVPLWAVPAWIAAAVLALWYIAKRIGRS